jgi:cAMP-dependent protein kinase regulator
MPINRYCAGMDEDARKIIVDAMSQKQFTKGGVIIQQGDPGDYFYVISSGTCDILVNGKKVLETGKGKGFGELALLYDAPRAATVIATSDEVHTWAVDRVTFKQVMMGTTMKKVRQARMAL